MTKSELQIMRCVVDGLRLIHRGQDHVKDALSHVVTTESYSPYQYIVKRPYEAQLSCYYILHGAVQVGVMKTAVVLRHSVWGGSGGCDEDICRVTTFCLGRFRWV